MAFENNCIDKVKMDEMVALPVFVLKAKKAVGDDLVQKIIGGQ